MVLGSLIKRARELKIWPKRDPPYDTQSFLDVTRSIRQMKLTTLCQEMSLIEDASTDSKIKQRIEKSMKSLESGIPGLDLDDFKDIKSNTVDQKPAHQPEPPM
jgi:hypothetical protein